MTADADADSDAHAERERAKAVWALGDYAQVAARLEPAAHQLVQASGVSPGSRVLDVGAGTGNVTAAAARAGGRVVASDIAPSMIERGRARTEGLDVEWQEADVQSLPFEDDRFDQTLSCFGAIFAPDPARTAAELLRVTKPGGAVAITAWEHRGMQEVLSDAMRVAVPDAPSRPAEVWGSAEASRGHFARAGATSVDVERHEFEWPFDDIDAWLRFWDEAAPPFVAARKAIGEERWVAVQQQLKAAIAPHADTSAGTFVLRPGYFLVVARP
jgi:SAM-dependent methyltransferase